MKIVLILVPSYPGRKRVSSAPPLSLLYVGTFLKKFGHDIVIIDADINGYKLDDLTSEIIAEKPDLVGINTMTPFAGTVLNLSKRLKKLNPGLNIVLGGPHITATGSEILKFSDDASFLVIGEGEYTMLELTKKLENHETDFSNIKGLVYKKRNEIVVNPPRELIQDLDSLPNPDFSLIKKFDVNNYELFHSEGKKVVNVLASRGCPFRCSFCQANLTHGCLPRMRSVKNVIDEIKFNRNKYGVGYIGFKDSTFTFNHPWLEEFCHQMIERKLGMEWVCNARIDTVNEDLIRLMSAAGCNAMAFGVESGSQRILDVLQKGTKVEEIPKVYDWLKKYKIAALAAMMVGNPTETLEDVEETYKLAIRLNPIAIGFNCLTAFPGTKIYDDALQDKTLANPAWYFKSKDENGDYPLLDLFDGTLHLPAFDPKIMVNRVARRYYFRPAYIFVALKRVFSNKAFFKYAVFYIINIAKGRLSHV